MFGFVYIVLGAVEWDEGANALERPLPWKLEVDTVFVYAKSSKRFS